MQKKKPFSIFLTIFIIVALFVSSILSAVCGGAVGVVVAIPLFVMGLVMLIWYITTYNSFVKHKHKAEQSFSLIDIHLKLRYDLIPNLVNTVKGYAKHEKDLFTEIAKLRTLAKEAKDDKEKVDIANKTLPKIEQILVLAEKYPDLKASDAFKRLMEELVEIEDKLVASRRIYGNNVNIYNTKLQTFPSSIVANQFGFEKKELFKIETGENINIEVSFASEMATLENE